MEKKKILLVDDAPVFREVMGDILEEKGFEVQTASDGLEAMEAIRKKAFDLIMLDLMLPRMTGFDLLKQIKKQKETREVPVLAVSGIYTREEHMAVLKQLGAEGFANKSLTPREIADRAVRALDQGATGFPEGEDQSPDWEPGAMAPEDALSEMTLFSDLDGPQLQTIVAISRKVSFGCGDEIIREGEEGDRFYGIISGSVLVQKEDPEGKLTLIARLGPGDGFGEMALADNEKRSATCMAETEVEAMEISRDDFERALAGDAELERKCLRSLIRLLAERLRETDVSLTFSRALLEKVIEP